MPFSYVSTNPEVNDKEVQLLGKLLQSIGGFAQAGDTPVQLLGRILSAVNAAAAGGSGSVYVDVEGDTMTGLLTISGSLTDHLILDRVAADTQGATIRLRKQGTTGNAAAAVAADEGIFQIRALAYDGTTLGAAGRVQVNANGTQTGSNHSSYFRWQACLPGTTTETEIFRVTSLASTGSFITFGGVTASEPALKKNGAVLEVRLADNSNYGSFTSGFQTSTTGGMQMNTDDSATLNAYNYTFQKRGTTGDATAAVGNASEIGNMVWQSWNGAAYVQNASFLAKTTQVQSVGNAGGELQLRTTTNGSTSPAIAAIVSNTKNFLISNVNTVEPASLVGGIVWKDGTAASADPTTASAMWSVGGEIQYRTSGASEGAGQTNRLHNRSGQQAGVGTNYTLTNATAQVAFGTTNATVTLPTAGTYLVQANVSIINGATADDIYDAKLRNTTDSTDIGVNKKVSGGPASGRVNIVLMELVTIAASKVVTIFAFNETAARGTVESTTTDIRFVRLS